MLETDKYLNRNTKVRVLYNPGKFQEALEILEKNWKLKPVYDHELFQHFEEVRKAIINNERQ